MVNNPRPVFRTQTVLAQALFSLLQKLDSLLREHAPVRLDMYLAGGMAVYLYAANRPTSDVDADFVCSKRLLIPDDLTVDVVLEDGKQKTVYIDKNYNSTFALMHEDYQSDALLLDTGLAHLRLFVLSPVDLVVSKLARFSPGDQQDIFSLIRAGLVTEASIKTRADHALEGFIGDRSFLRHNLRDQNARQTPLFTAGKDSAESQVTLLQTMG